MNKVKCKTMQLNKQALKNLFYRDTIYIYIDSLIYFNASFNSSMQSKMITIKITIILVIFK